MKKIYILFTFIFLLSACGMEEKVINKGVDKNEFLKKANIKETIVASDKCIDIIQSECSYTILNDNTSYGYGFTLTCSYPNTVFFSTEDAINDFYPNEVIKDNLQTTRIKYDRFLSDDITYKYLHFNTVSIYDYDNKVYLNINNACYQWDFANSPYKFIK